MRIAAVFFAVAAMLGSSEEARAQACAVFNGVDYQFERRVAVREVNDEHDRGRVELVTYVYRPLRNDRRTIVLFSHGSIGGLSSHPREPFVLSCALKEFFLTRGYTLVVPTRRGRGESTGTYLEECGRRFDPACTPVRNREVIAPRALDEALADTLTVLDQVVFGDLASADSKVVLAGLSRGGFLSFAVAAERPRQVAAIISFAGGWLDFQPELHSADEQRLRLEFHQQRLRRFGARFAGPTLWLHAPDDPLYGEAITRRFHAAYLQGGGRGAYRSVPAQDPWRHVLIGQSEPWARDVEVFLDAL